MGESEGEDGIGSGGFLTSTRNSGDGSRRCGLTSEGDRRWRCELATAAMATARLGLRWWQRLLLGLKMEAVDTAAPRTLVALLGLRCTARWTASWRRILNGDGGVLGASACERMGPRHERILSGGGFSEHEREVGDDADPWVPGISV